MHLRIVSYKQQKPWMMRKGQNDCQLVLCELIKYLSRSMNFTYNFIDVTHFGIFNAQNQSWSGAMGRFQRNVWLLIVLIN